MLPDIFIFDLVDDHPDFFRHLLKSLNFYLLVVQVFGNGKVVPRIDSHRKSIAEGKTTPKGVEETKNEIK